MCHAKKGTESFLRQDISPFQQRVRLCDDGLPARQNVPTEGVHPIRSLHRVFVTTWVYIFSSCWAILLSPSRLVCSCAYRTHRGASFFLFDLTDKVSVHLVEASDNIMGSFDEKLISYTTRLLENRKVSEQPSGAA